MVLADLRRLGHGVAIPFGHDLPFDLILVRCQTGALEKVQCKYTESDGRVVHVKIRSSSDWVSYRYTAELVDWVAVYDLTTDRCFYLHSDVWSGHSELSLRLVSTTNGQRRGVRWADDYTFPDRVDGHLRSVNGNHPSLPSRSQPE